MENEINYGKSLKDKYNTLLNDVYLNATNVKCWHNEYGNPTYSLIYKGKKALFIDDHGIDRSQFKAKFTFVNRKVDL